MASDDAKLSCTGRIRQYPEEPRVGIGVVMLRKGPAKHDGSQAAEVLLVRRAKAPEIGKWTVPGGSLELGEEAGFSVKLTPCTYRRDHGGLCHQGGS